MRSYNQVCPAAHALDLVGERWSLLIVRELLFGAKRYTDLQDGLPGIGPTVLTERLRRLEDAGVLERRRLDPPAAATVYELTELGEGLRPVLVELFRWGMRSFRGHAADGSIRASWLLAAIEATADPQRVAADVEESYEFRVGEEVLSLTLSGGQLQCRHGAADDPALILHTDPETFAAVGTGRVSPRQAARDGRLRIEGEQAAAARALALFGLLERAVAA